MRVLQPDDAVEVRSELRRLALAEGVAGGAALGDALALGGIGRSDFGREAAARAAAGRGRGAGRRSAASGRLRQFLGAVGILVEIGEQRRALLGALDARERHRGAGDVALRVFEPVVEVLEVPDLVGGLLHRVGIGEALLMRVLQPDDPEKVRPELGRLALAEGVAGRATLGDAFALRRIGRSEQRERAGRGRAAAAGRAGFLLLSNLIAGLRRLLVVGQFVDQHADAQHDR